MSTESFGTNAMSLIPMSTTVPYEKIEAATTIQKVWRSHVDRQIFNFYKNLIGFHTQALAKNISTQNSNFSNLSSQNPTENNNSSPLVTATSGQCAATVMRLICPKEAQFMDDAAGTHVRFRLASPTSNSKYGTFPPAVYYKIYTHRPIVDLCATAPRDYTKAVNKQSLPGQRFNNDDKQDKNSKKGGNTFSKINNIQLNLNSTNNTKKKNNEQNSYNPETAGWYQRFENNSWRPISEKLLLASLYSSPMPPGSFKPTARARRIKRSNEKKRKRVAWLRKIYFSSADPISHTDESLIEDAIDNMAVLAEQDTNENDPLVTDVHDINAEIDDEDVQALIEWTDCLADFDDYQNFWAHLGTAGFPSIEILGERSQSAIHRREDKKRKLGSVINSSEREETTRFDLAELQMGEENFDEEEDEYYEETAQGIPEQHELDDLDFLTLDALETSIN